MLSRLFIDSASPARLSFVGSANFVLWSRRSLCKPMRTTSSPFHNAVVPSISFSESSAWIHNYRVLSVKGAESPQLQTSNASFVKNSKTCACDDDDGDEVLQSISKYDASQPIEIKKDANSIALVFPATEFMYEIGKGIAAWAVSRILDKYAAADVSDLHDQGYKKIAQLLKAGVDQGWARDYLSRVEGSIDSLNQYARNPSGNGALLDSVIHDMNYVQHGLFNLDSAAEIGAWHMSENILIVAWKAKAEGDKANESTAKVVAMEAVKRGDEFHKRAVDHTYRRFGNCVREGRGDWYYTFDGHKFKVKGNCRNARKQHFQDVLASLQVEILNSMEATRREWSQYGN